MELFDTEKFYSYFAEFQPNRDGVQIEASCPLHEGDTNPSFVVRPETRQFRCFGCGEGGGPVRFLQLFLGISKNMAMYAVDFFSKHEKLPFPDKVDVDNYHRTLMQEEELLNYFDQHGVNTETLEEFKVGWDIQSRRIVFPIPSPYEKDWYINLRKYAPPGSSKNNRQGRKVINLSSLGESTFYPFKAFEKETIFIVEGEKDMIVARGNGLNAVTGTGGGTLPSKHMINFTDKKVYLMTDNDEIGDKLAKDYRQALMKFTRDIVRIKLPEKDYADSIVKNPDLDVLEYIETNHSPSDIGAEAEAEAKEKLGDEDIETMSLADAFLSKNTNKRVKIGNLRVIGEQMRDYQVPVEATLDNGQKIEVPEREILAFINASDKIINDTLLAYAGDDEAMIMSRKEKFAQKIFFKEDVNLFSKDIAEGEIENVTGIYLSDGKRIKSNQVYDMEVMRTTHPRTQENMFIIFEAEECVYDNVISEETLEFFRREDEDISVILDEYYAVWAPHLEVTGRKDLFTILLLTYLSVLEYQWKNSTMKGWLDTIIVGDTRTGKTKMIRNFMNTLRMGEYVSGENAKATGIIGGINRMGDTWSLNWGKIPLNDKRLVVIDEASGLSVEDISQLSQMRSEGVLSITKIKQETTYARTRLLWITNPRNGERINNHYWKGYEAIEKFLPIQEDLARFDIACSAAIEDVDNIFEYSELELMTEEELDKWRQLVLFAWNLPKEDIVISQEVADDIIKRSILLGKRYNESVLFLSVNGYEKLTRVAISLAVLTFSYIEGKLIVDHRHVAYAENLFKELYDKSSFGLGDKVKVESKKENVSQDDKTVLKGMEAIYDNLSILFRDGEVPQSMVGTILGIDQSEANKVIADLYGMGLVTIVSGSSNIKPTSSFMEYVRSD